MYSNEETTTIRTYTAPNGQPLARITATRDYDGTGEKAGAYCHTTAHTVVIGAGYRVDESYYTDTQTPQPDGPIMAAWNRYSRDDYGNEIDGHEASELTQRYARTYWPMVPVIESRILTGYSQGDEVTVLSWIEPDNLYRTPTEPAYRAAERGHKEIEGHHEIMGAVSRGQYWTVALETAELTYTADDDDDEDTTYTAEVTWTEKDSVLTLAMEEFDPWAELIECAESNLETPADATTTDATTTDAK